MDFRDVTLQAITDFSEQLDAALDGLTPEQWRWRPTPSANHIMWIVWHLTRVEDMWINSYLAEADQVWEKRGWADKINMPAEDRFGVGDTPEQVGAFPDVAPELIAGYRADVLASVGPVIRGLTESDLPTTRPEKNPLRPRPAPTVLWVLARISVECSQHIGQVAYIRGLMPEQENWRT
ncbi:MAG: DUF664 domain-containing protein [Chloroflexi bacterium]|nr:DUF664 domain-containing protein [Chloroflexota bacterium]